MTADSKLCRSSPRALWIAAHRHRRTTGLCCAWDIPLFLVRPGSPSILIWIARLAETLRVLYRERPGILFVANPSLVLTVLAYLVRPVFGFRLVVDAHNEGVRPFDRTGRFVRWLTRRILRGANATIVSNEALARDVFEAGGRPLILPDRLPVPPARPSIPMAADAAPQVVVIATFRRDEPISAIVEAARAMPDVRFVLTGDSSRFETKNEHLPPNLHLNGHVSDDEYWTLLAEAEVVCDLTLKADCLVCGAYEALALAKPMVLSNGAVTRELFGPAAVLTRNAPSDIVDAVRAALEESDRLTKAARELREAYRVRWQSQSETVWNAIVSGARAPAGARVG